MLIAILDIIAHQDQRPLSHARQAHTIQDIVLISLNIVFLAILGFTARAVDYLQYQDLVLRAHIAKEDHPQTLNLLVQLDIIVLLDRVVS